MATFALPAARPATRRWATLASFALFLLLCASIAYWGMQLFKPPARAVAPVPQAQTAAVNTAPAATLFGGKSGGEANAANFQLHGLVLASTLANTSLIMSIDGKPAQAFRADREIAPGVTVKEVQPGYVVLSDNGVPRRVELPAELKATNAAEADRTDPRVAAARNTPPPRTMPNVPNTPAPAAPATSPAMPAQQGQQTPPPQPQVGPGVPVPAYQTPAANAGTASAGSSGAGTTGAGTAGAAGAGTTAAGTTAAGPTAAGTAAAGTTAAGTSGATGNGAAGAAQQPVYVQSPPSMGANTAQAQQPAQGGGQQSQAANQSVVHGQTQQLPGTAPAR